MAAEMDKQLRQDLDVLLSLYLRWRGWGNYELDPPLLALWELAHETANRLQEFDSYGAKQHVTLVLTRAKVPEPKLSQSADLIVDTIETYVKIRSYMTTKRAGQYLNHARTLEIHPACQPTSDSRWDQEPTLLLWDDGRVETYVCLKGGDEIESDRRHFSIESVKDFLHREDGPALISYWKSDRAVLQDTVWYRMGHHHREDGPALVFRDHKGKVRHEGWYQNDLLHRIDGPAEIFHPNHFVGQAEKGFQYSWFLEGSQYPFPEYLTQISTEARKALSKKMKYYTERDTFHQRRAEDLTIYNSVFISYGGPDEKKAAAINAALKRKGITTWFFPDDAQPGQRLHRVMFEGVRRHDKVLLLCSKHSLTRNGVKNEIEQVLVREASEGGAEILIPARLDNHVFQDWAEDRPDLMEQVRSRVIADFGGIFKDADKFQQQVDRLTMALLK